MNIHNVAQGSDAWHTLRSQYFTASEAPAMMGASKYQSRTQLLASKSSGIAPDVSPTTQRIFDQGHAAEAAARIILEAQIGEDLFPVVGSSVNLLASMDGMTMIGDVLYEHKLLNQGLVAQIRAGELDPHYYWQLEQQLLVSGAEKVIFVCSDGTAENFHQVEYRAVPGRAEQLVAGWKQFEADLAAFIPEQAAPLVIGQAPDELPALRIELTGMVTASNLQAFESSALAVIGAVKTNLQTDQDFADAKKAVVWCGDVEKAVAAAKQQALSQTASIEDLFKALDRVSANARETRLKVDKMVKAQELSIKVQIKQQAEAAFAAHIATINATLGRLVMPAIAVDFAGAMKSKRTLASLRDAVDSEVARGKIEANRVADQIRINLASLSSLAGEHKFLFADAQQLALKASDDLIAVIKSRIADHDAAEAAKIAAKAEQERERIRAEERKRLADEQAAKDKAEQAAQVMPEPVTIAATPVTVAPSLVTVAPAAQPVRSEPASISQSAPLRRITLVIDCPTNSVYIGMPLLGGSVVFVTVGDYSTTIEDAA